jgi:hypothetical protein
VQSFKGSKVQRFKGSKVQRFKGSKVYKGLADLRLHNIPYTLCQILLLSLKLRWLRAQD